jgi:hypothetical protein
MVARRESEPVTALAIFEVLPMSAKRGKKDTITIDLPYGADLELPREVWNFYISVLNGAGVKNLTPVIQDQLSWLFGDFLKELMNNGDLLGSVVKIVAEDFKKNPKPYVTGLDGDKPKKKKKESRKK